MSGSPSVRVIRRRGGDIPLTRINDVTFDQGILDRIFKAGTPRVSAASEEGTVVLVDLPRIHQVALRLNERVRAGRDRGQPGTA